MSPPPPRLKFCGPVDDACRNAQVQPPPPDRRESGWVALSSPGWRRPVPSARPADRKQSYFGFRYNG